ncbi:MAG TPA: AAA family ATPase [Pirellulaceae bacterium]|nr:AAA family ATPase [Pirellulaceae bacterium]
MRIDRLDLIAYGPFTDAQLDLSRGSHGLHLVFGPNEAGKSSTLRALSDALFGIPGQTSDAFVHPYTDLRIGMSLRTADDRPIAFVRRKGNRETLRDPETGAALPAGLLDPILGAVDREHFRSMFGLDHERLVAGGRQIAELGNDIGQMLFSATGSMTDIRRIRDALAAEQGELFAPQARTKRIHLRLKTRTELLDRLKGTRTSSSRLEKLQHDLDACRDRIAALDEQVREAGRAVKRADLIRRSIEPLRQFRQLDERLAAIPETPELPTDFLDRVHDLRRRRAALGVAIEQQERRHRELTEGLRETERREGPAPNVAEIAELQDERGAHRKGERDLPGLRMKAAERRERIELLLRRTGHADGIEQANRLRLPTPLRTEIGRLTQERAALIAERTDLQRSEDEVRSALQGVVEDLSGLAEFRATEPLAAAIDAWVANRELPRNAERLQLEIDAARRELEQWSARNGRWTGSLDLLARTPLPTGATIERFALRLDDSSKGIAEVDAAIREDERERQRLTRELDSLRADRGELPTLEELREGREERDRRWAQVRLRWLSPQEAGADRSGDAKLADDVLADRFEQQLRQTDLIADRLRAEAQSVAEAARLVADLERREERIAERQQERRRRAAEREAIETEWRSVWEGLPIRVDVPREMLVFVGERTQLIERQERLARIEDERATIERRIAATRADLAAAANAAGLSVEAGERAETIVERLRRQKEEIEDARAARRRLEEQRKELERRDREIAQRRTRLEDRERSWRDAWRSAMEPLGLNAETDPTVAAELLELRLELERTLDELLGSEGLEGRIEAIGSEREAFEARVRRAAATAFGGEVPEGSVDDLLAALVEGAAEAERLARNRERLEGELHELEPELRSKREASAVIEAELEAAIEAAGVDSIDRIDAVWRAGEERRELRQNRAAVERTLAGLAGGGDWSDLEREVDELLAGMGEEGLAAEIERLEADVARLDDERQTLRVRWGALQEEWKGIGDGEEAIAIEAERRVVEAELESDVREYCRLKGATYLLSRAIERFQARHEGPMLTTAGELFARLTCGAYDGLAIDHGDGEVPRLVGRRRGTGAEVPIRGMSEGTADQLYLALRLAYLTEWVAHHEPLPLIVDDVLIKFDDDRAAATLEVLADFSDRTQVVLFTHHEHLLELIDERLGKSGRGRVFVSRLGESTG